MNRRHFLRNGLWIAASPALLIARKSIGQTALFGAKREGFTAGALVGGGGSAPAYIGEITAARLSETSSAGTSVVTTNSTVPVGQHIVIFTYDLSLTENVSGITDTGGNTYTQRATYLTANNDRMMCWSAPVTTQLTSGQSITITWGTPAFTWRGAIYMAASNIGATPIDNTATGALTFGTSCAGATVTTTAANTLVFSWIMPDGSQTYSGGSFTNIGAAQVFGSATPHNVFLQSAFTSNGAKSSGGTLSGNSSTFFMMIAFK